MSPTSPTQGIQPLDDVPVREHARPAVAPEAAAERAGEILAALAPR